MGFHDPLFYTPPAPTTRLVAMKVGYTKRSDLIAWCHDAIPEYGRAEEIAHKHMVEFHSGVDYVLINSLEWEKLPA